MKIRVADYIVNYLEDISVKKVFLLSGGGIMHLIDAISRSKKISYIANHHEQSCAIAADSYARVSNNLGVCYATSGPGATNTITGVVGAWQDSTPVLFITGQSKLSQTIHNSKINDLRQFGTFEVNIIPIVKSITKYAVFLDDPKAIRYHLEKAYYLAMSGRPGPVFIDIPVDIQGALIDPDELKGFVHSEENLPIENEIQDEVFLELLKQIRNAKRPLFIAGHGVRVSGSVEKFKKIIKILDIPVVTTQLSIDLLEYEFDFFVGHPGIKGDRAGNFAVQSADLIITLGCSLHTLTTGYEIDCFAPNARIIQIEIDPAVIRRQQVKISQTINCTVQHFLTKIEKFIDPQLFSLQKNWRELCKKWKLELSIQNEPHKKYDDKINYYQFIDNLSHLANEHDILVSDAGSAFYVMGHAFRPKQKQRVIISGSLGAMGFALPAATGASLAAPNNAVICITGDGSLQTNIHELATISHHKLNIKLFVLNNCGYVSIRNTQNNFFKGHFVGVDKNSGVFFPQLDKIAQAYEMNYLFVQSPNELTSVIQKTLNMDGPVICEIFTTEEQEIIPTVSSLKREDGSMQSQPLHNMYPFFPQEKLNKYFPFLES